MNKMCALAAAGILASVLTVHGEARADAKDAAAPVLAAGYLVSSVGGIVTAIGTGVAIRDDSLKMREWAIASAVTGSLNVGYAALFFIAAASPCGFPCMDLRGPAVGLGAFSTVVAAVNVGLAVRILTAPKVQTSTRSPAFTPTVMFDVGGMPAPGAVVSGRF